MYTVTINNVPEYAKNYEYIVARKVDTELWFWGAYSDRDRAEQVAIDEDGLVINNRV